jgi:dihydrofolate reductase
MLAPLALIVAHDRNRVIGYQGDLPWHHPENLKYFKRQTLHRSIIMGRASFESIGRPLPKRRNIVLSRKEFHAEGIEVFDDLTKAIASARSTDDEPFITGGAQIYELALPYVTRCYITKIDEAHQGDTYFPALAPDEWQLVDQQQHGVLSFNEYQRQETPA